MLSIDLKTLASDVLLELEKKMPSWSYNLDKNTANMRDIYGQYSITIRPDIIRQVNHGNLSSMTHIRLNFKDVDKIEISNSRNPILINISSWKIPDFDIINDIADQAIKYHVNYINNIYITLVEIFNMNAKNIAEIEKFLTDNLPGFCKSKYINKS